MLYCLREVLVGVGGERCWALGLLGREGECGNFLFFCFLGREGEGMELELELAMEDAVSLSVEMN